MIAKILHVFCLWILPVVSGVNQCSLVDQLVDMKMQLKEIVHKDLDLRHQFESYKQDSEIVTGDIQKSISEIQQTLSDEMTKNVQQDQQLLFIQEQFQNLTAFVKKRWNEMGQALVALETEFKQNLSLFKASMDEEKMATNFTLAQIERSTQESVDGFKDYVSSIHNSIANVSKAQLSPKSRCIGYNYNYVVKFNLCYRLGYDVGKTWRDHRNTCLSEHGDLLTLESTDQLEWLQDLIEITPKVRTIRTIHIDGNDEGREGEWKNKYGKPMWTRWASGQPNSYNSGDAADNDGGQHCNSLHKSNKYLMNDCSCDHNYNSENGYFCEIKL